MLGGPNVRFRAIVRMPGQSNPRDLLPLLRLRLLGVSFIIRPLLHDDLLVRALVRSQTEGLPLSIG